MSQNLIASPVTEIALELDERCDRCGASAKITVTLASGGELAFCGHHGNRYAGELLSVGRRVLIESGYEWWGATI